MKFSQKRTPVLPNSGLHPILGTPLMGPFEDGSETIDLAMGCFWGGERMFWIPGVIGTVAGYEGGVLEHPTYREVCTGKTGHAETVRVTFRPAEISLEQLLARFWENHDPTQGDRQGNDVGPQYRSAIFCTTAKQFAAATASKDAFEKVLARAGKGPITTEILGPDAARMFYPAEDEHQAYLYKHPNGYCNLGPNGFSCPTGIL
ncbi:MAG: peptide-methionine (S)-S-oxide reductase MsrA [Actinomycetaceae bacterium]|nr:peptide-methionine (S)-S-oxide reductase MsrA [Actinomycetaceae bacterium]